MVGVARFELATPWSQTKCATRLRYTPILSDKTEDEEYLALITDP